MHKISNYCIKDIVDIRSNTYLNSERFCNKVRSKYRECCRLNNLPSVTPCYDGVRGQCATQCYEGFICRNLKFFPA